jgi:hypothetical protein
MAAETLLASLAEFIALERDYSAGQAQKPELDAVKKRLAQAINEYVDHRVEASITRRRSQKSEQRIALADTINSAMKSTAASVKSIHALNSAPPPPANNDPEAMKKWWADYKEWYERVREEGVGIK